MADDKKKLRSQWWFDDPHDIGMTAMRAYGGARP